MQKPLTLTRARSYLQGQEQQDPLQSLPHNLLQMDVVSVHISMHRLRAQEAVQAAQPCNGRWGVGVCCNGYMRLGITMETTPTRVLEP